MLNQAEFDRTFAKWVGGNRQIPFQLGMDMFTTIAPYATIGVTKEGGRFYKHWMSTSPVFVAPWADRIDDIVRTGYELATEATFNKRTATFKPYDVNKQLYVAEVLSGIQEATSPFKLVNFVLSEAGRNIALEDEKIFINNVLDNGAKMDSNPDTSTPETTAATYYNKDCRCYLSDNKTIDIVKTIYTLVAHLRSVKNNWRREDMLIYMTPELTMKYSLANILTNNGTSSYWAQSIEHRGLVGQIAGVKIIEVPTMELVKDASTGKIKTNFMMCNTAPNQIFSLARPQGLNALRVTPATEKHLDQNDLYVKGLIYMNWGLKNRNSAFCGLIEDLA